MSGLVGIPKAGFLMTQLISVQISSSDTVKLAWNFFLHLYYAPNFKKVGGHIGFGLSVCLYVRMYVCMYVFMFEISS